MRPISTGGDPKKKFYPSQMTAEALARYLTETRSLPGRPYDFSAAADTIAAHESDFTMDPLMRQYDGGPGRGKYQFEPDAAVTAANRLRQLAAIFGLDNPGWNTGERDVTRLTEDQQDMLFYADKIMADDARTYDLAQGKIPLSQFWAEGHYRGPEKETRMKSFDADREYLQEHGFPKKQYGGKIKINKYGRK